MSSVTRPSVLERAKRGDADEFARLYGPLAFAFARKCGLGDDLAEDVMQQTMTELLQLLPTFVYDPARSFKGLVKRIVQHRAMDLRRRSLPARMTDALNNQPDENDDLEALFEREWLKALLSVALDRVRVEVRPTTFQVFQLYVLSEWPVDKIKATLGVTDDQIYHSKNRILARLRSHIEELQREAT